MKKLFRLFILVIIIIAIVFVWKYKIEDFVMKQMYPIKYSEYVEMYSEEYNMDPLLVYSIIKAESNFNPNAKSHSNAYGLMQVTKSTGKETARKLGIEFKNAKVLYEPETNIRIGIAYFDYLLKRYDDNMNIAIIAYNAGFGNVDKWISEGIIKEDGEDLENVPFKETNNYARKIINNYEIYKKLY